MSASAIKRNVAAIGAAALLAGAAGCGPTTSTGKFHGESHAVAQRISEFQNHASGSGRSEICKSDLSAALRARLTTPHRSCTKTIEEQLAQVDTFEVEIQSIALAGTRASARVKSTWSGKQRAGTLSLVREAGSWRIAALR